MSRDGYNEPQPPLGLQIGMGLFGLVSGLFAIFWAFLFLWGNLGLLWAIVLVSLLWWIPAVVLYWIGMVVFIPATVISTTLLRGSQVGRVFLGLVGLTLGLALSAILVGGAVFIFLGPLATGTENGGQTDTYYQGMEVPLDRFTQTMDDWAELDGRFGAQLAEIVYFTDVQRMAGEMVPEIDRLTENMRQVEAELFALTPTESLQDDHDAIYGLAQQFRDVLSDFRRAADATEKGLPHWRDVWDEAGTTLDDFNLRFARTRSDMLRVRK